MEKSHGIFIPEKHELWRKFFIPFPELEKNREKRRCRNLTGDVGACQRFFQDASKVFAGGFQLFCLPLKKLCIFF